MILQEIKTQTNWSQASSSLRSNFRALDIEVEKLKNATIRDKGYFSSLDALIAHYPLASAGDRAFVGTVAPYYVYIWDASGEDWVETGETIDTEPSVKLGNYYTKDDVDGLLGQYYDQQEVFEMIEEVRVSANEDAEFMINSKHIALTQEEYDARIDAGQIRSNSFYYIFEE